MKSWKIGAIAGLIAGIVQGIVYSTFIQIAASFELMHPDWRPIIASSVEVNILLPVLWWIIFGIIFSKVYGVIPGKGMLKGFFFIIVLYLFITIRGTSFNLSYGYYQFVAGNLFCDTPSCIASGLVLGIAYESLHNRYYPSKKVSKIKQYDMISGFYPGAIAGLIGGMVASVVAILGPVLGIWGYNVPVELSFDLWWGQAGTHIFLNMVWGIIFGMVYAKVYNLIPSKGILKGAIYGLILYAIINLFGQTFVIGWAISSSEWALFTNIILWALITGFFQALAFGLALGAIYRKPVK